MLGLGVIIISRSDQFAFDLSSALSGAALGIPRADIIEQAWRATTTTSPPAPPWPPLRAAFFVVLGARRALGALGRAVT